MTHTIVPPDLQASIACEDVRVEMGGSQTLVGVLNALFAPEAPVRLLKFCIWTRWCSGQGKFQQSARVINPDEDSVICENAIEFALGGLDQHATNVHFFTGIQFPAFGIYHIEIRLNDELVLRYPLIVAQRAQPTQ